MGKITKTVTNDKPKRPGRKPKQNQPTGDKTQRARRGRSDDDTQSSSARDEALQACSALPSLLIAQTEALKQMVNSIKEIKSTMNQNEREDDNLEGQNDSSVECESITGKEDSESPLEFLLKNRPSCVLVKGDMKETDAPGYIQAILDKTQTIPEYGPVLNEKVAQSFSRVPSQVVSNETLEQVKSNYLVPENCKELSVPKINATIWQDLPQNAKSKDAQYQFLQQQVCRALTANAKVVDLLYSSCSSLPESTVEIIMKIIMDGSTSLGVASRDINSRRKRALKPFIHEDYVSLCNGRVSGEWLFGENLEQEMKAAKATGKIVRSKAKPRGRPFVRRGYNRKSQVAQQYADQPLNLRAPPPPSRGGGGYRGGRGRGRRQFHRQDQMKFQTQ